MKDMFGMGEETIKMSRGWAMPNGDTFSIKPIANLLGRYINLQHKVLDPFARNSKWGTITNDLSPSSSADYHMEADKFCALMNERNVKVDIALFDPPYSPRQCSEIYKSVGMDVGMKGTQNAAMYKRVRDALDPLIKPGGLVLSFGWHSNGMGKGRNYVIEEILLVAHGGAHNDTICIVEKKRGR